MANTKVPVELSSTPSIVDNGNATAITIDSSENVGIGTSSPAVPLHINSLSQVSNRLAIFESDINNLNEYSTISVGSNTLSANFGLMLTTSDTAYIGVGSSGNVFDPTTGTGLYVNANGKVGIGASSPENRLHVKGAANTLTTIQIESASNQYAPKIVFDGLVGASADYLLGQIVASWDTHTNEVAAIRFESGSDTTNKDDGLISFWTSDAGSTLDERMRIDSVGEVSIKRAGSGGTGVLKALNLNHAGTSVNDGAKISFTAGTSTEGAGIASTGQALNSADLRFYTGGTTERMRILAGGGLTFNGDTATANALDDYEEGTWTPACGATLSTATGHYTKIGNQVTVHYHVVTTGGLPTSTAQVQISGLPFTIDSNGAGAIYARYYTPNDSTLTTILIDGESVIRLINTNDQNFDYTIWGELEASANNSVDIRGTATYKV